MSFKALHLYPCAPATTRGEATKISSSGDKIVYTNGRTVIIRDLSAANLGVAYSGHALPATIARISPSGYYCASADNQGTVRIWDVAGTAQTLNAEYKVIAGKINDLAWDGESKRIIAVGDGREKFGHPFMMDTGSSSGEIAGHSKAINSVAIRHQRPFRAVTAGDDSLIVFHQGVPFKYDKTIKNHTRFVQDVKYAASGDLFASVGSDAKVFVYDGKTGDTIAEITEDAHKGTVYACAWNAPGNSLVTSSADCTVKLWDAETKKCKLTWTVGSGVSHQQTGNTWTGQGAIVSVSMSGDINIFDERTGGGPVRVLSALQKSVTAGAVDGGGTFFAGAYDGRVVSFNTSDGAADIVKGTGHPTQVSEIAMDGERLVTAGFDDTMREIDPGRKSFTSTAVSTTGQPRAMCAANGVAFVASPTALVAIKGGQLLSTVPIAFAAGGVATDGSVVAVGGDDMKVHLYKFDGNKLLPDGELASNKSAVTALALSSDGKLLAAGESSGKIIVYDMVEKTAKITRWTAHSARINALSWTADSKHCVSGSLDTHVFVWSVEKPLKNIAIRNACPGGVSVVAWLPDGSTVLVAGHDACVRSYQVTFHA